MKTATNSKYKPGNTRSGPKLPSPLRGLRQAWIELGFSAYAASDLHQTRTDAVRALNLLEGHGDEPKRVGRAFLRNEDVGGEGRFGWVPVAT